MNPITDTIKSRYSSNLPLLLWQTALILFMYALYRVRIYHYILEIHPDLKLASFFEFATLSLHADSIAVIATQAVFFILSFLLGGLGRVKHAVVFLCSISFGFFLLLCMEFFRIYQTTFQRNFAGREHFSGLANVIDSILAEFSGEFYILFLIVILATAGAHYFIYRRELYLYSSHHDNSPGKRLHAGFMSLTIPMTILVIMLLGLATDASIPGRQFAPRYERDHAARKLSLLTECASNPFVNLFMPGTPQSQERSAPGTSVAGHFSFGLNTDSLVSDTHHDRIQSIPRKKKQSIILFFFESTPRKYYDLKINGRYVVETWHRLEQNSINFTSHYANYPLSANALLTVFTSAYDLNSKDMVIEKYPDIRLLTVSEILKEKGYRTCLIHTGGLGYAGQKRFLKNRKFDRIIEYDDLVHVPPYNRQVGWGVDERAMVKPAVEFIEKSRDTPYLLVLLPVNPHHPYACPDDSFRITGRDTEKSPAKKSTWLKYLNSLHYADASLGMLVDELERRNLLDDTLLFLFADHGEAFYQHKMNYNHPLFLYNENVHVPFLIYSKTLFREPEYHDGITRHIDILPTILDILGLPSRPEQEGVSVLSARREQLAVLHTSWKDDYMGIVDRNWKYISRTGDRTEELYDLHEDPEEKDNIAGEHQDLIVRFRRYIDGVRTYKSEYYRRMTSR